MANDYFNLALIIVLSVMALSLWPRRFPIQVIVIYWIQILIIPFIQDKQIYSSAYVADFCVLAIGLLSTDPLGIPVAIISALFMAGHTVGYGLYLEAGSPVAYDLILSVLYLILIQQFYVKGARDAARGFISRLRHSRYSKNSNDVVGRCRRDISNNIQIKKARK